MPIVSPSRKQIFQEEVKYKSAVSESTGTRIAASINFILARLHSEKQFFLNGEYGRIAAQTFVDGLAVFEFDAEIFNVWMFNIVAGSGGTTELDLKIATTPGGSFSSIFTTTPKITSAAASNVWIGVGGTVTGCTAPVLTAGAETITGGTAIKLDKIQSMTAAENCGLLVHYRPR